MSWYCYVGAGIVVFPFVVMASGFIASVFRRGERGVMWRFNIAHTFDMFVAACCGFATPKKKATISGWCWYKRVNSSRNIWDIYVWIIDRLFSEGHCERSAVEEGWASKPKG